MPVELISSSGDFFSLLAAQLGISHHSVATCMLRGIKRCVGEFDQVALELRIDVIHGHTDADCEMLNILRRAGKKFSVLHRPPQALGYIHRPVFGSLGQDDDKLLASITG